MRSAWAGVGVLVAVACGGGAAADLSAVEVADLIGCRSPSEVGEQMWIGPAPDVGLNCGDVTVYEWERSEDRANAERSFLLACGFVQDVAIVRGHRFVVAGVKRGPLEDAAVETGGQFEVLECPEE